MKDRTIYKYIVIFTGSYSFYFCQNKFYFTMRKELIDAIKAKFVGIDENTANRLATRAISKGEPITTEDEVAAVVDAITLADVVKSVSDFSADESKRKYETKYGLKDGKPVEDPKKEPEGKKTGEDPEPSGQGQKDDLKAALESALTKALAGLNGRLDTMSAEISAFKANRVAEGRKEKLNGIIKDLRDSQKKAYSRIALDKMSEEEFDSLLTEIKEEVNDIVAENKASGGVVGAPFGGVHNTPAPGKAATKEELDELVGKFNL